MTPRSTQHEGPTRKNRHAGKSLSLARIHPSPENDRLYRPISGNDPEIKALADSIRQFGVREPLVLTLDHYILSGHRRYVAAGLAGLETVPVRYESIRRSSDPDRFLRLLREFNRQRVKTRAEQAREEVVSADPTEAYESLIAHRNKQARVKVDQISIRGSKKRSRITKAKHPLLEAVMGILANLREYWPLTDRRIHYALLNNPPLRHASKPRSTYRNDDHSYEDLTNLLTRARIFGDIPHTAITDQTRPVIAWHVHQDVQSFVREELEGFLKGYWRDLMQSQPNHIEIVGEKNTIEPVIRTVAMRYCIPMTIGRGYSSLPPRHQIVRRYRRSGKEKLILLMLSDFDPDGEEIAHSFARSIRDDFDVEDIVPIKAALAAEQVVGFKLPPVMKAKESSVHYDRFTIAHGHDVFELEALHPRDLQRVLSEAIDSVIDIEAFNAELDAEKHDAAFLETVRNRAVQAIGDIAGDADE